MHKIGTYECSFLVQQYNSRSFNQFFVGVAINNVSLKKREEPKLRESIFHKTFQFNSSYVLDQVFDDSN